VVKGRSFVNLRDAGDPVECGKQYSEAGADELIFLDITATLEARKTILELAARVADEVFIPFTIGGGISTIEDARGLLSAGAEKISINTAAVRNKPLITEISEAFGNQAVVVAIDAKRTGESWEVYINAGTTPTGLDVIEWAKEVEQLGSGEIMLTSIDSDGHNAGYDIELNAAVNKAVTIPVIASGGAGGPEDMLAVFTEGKADAALAASIFHYGTYTIAEVKDYLRSHGVQVRT
jgi:cyclase